MKKLEKEEEASQIQDPEKPVTTPFPRARGHTHSTPPLSLNPHRTRTHMWAWHFASASHTITK